MAFRRQVKNFVKNYSDAEIKVREATSNDPWGPSSSLMLDISDLTFNTVSLSEIMNMLWQRLGDRGKNWRHVYKSLTLMDYLIKNGSKRVILHCREGFCNLQTLKDFQHIDEAGKDQGYYIREKSKQLMALLMDEQLLYKEREVARRTRRRTCSTAFPKRLPGAGNSPTACASAPTPENPASEKKHKRPKIASLRSKKNASKAGLKQEQCQDTQLPAGTALSQESLPLVFSAWKSTEDLMVFYDDDPKPLLPTVPPSVVSSSARFSAGAAEVCKLQDTGAVPARSGKSESPQVAVTLDRRSDGTDTDAVTENPLPVPPDEQVAAGSCEARAALPASWYSSKEEFISSNLKISKSDSAFYDRASVETLYVSPSFKTFDPVKEKVMDKDCERPAEPSTVQMVDESQPCTTTVRDSPPGTGAVLQWLRGARRSPATRSWSPRLASMSSETLSTTSEGTSSLSTLSLSSPESASPEKSAQLLHPLLAGPSFWTLPHEQPSSTSRKDGAAPAQARCPFAPESPTSSANDENGNPDPGEAPPGSSDSNKQMSRLTSSTWVELSTQNLDCFTSLSCSSFQTTRSSPRDPEANSSIKVLLGEVRNAIARLHEDLSLVIQELTVVNSHLLSMSGSGPGGEGGEGGEGEGGSPLL
ncbi:ENTH domain-containing protein 1 [Lepus europaeus]|uniref:ENTH domain-containing protein 1 n=1 Tax=Lepus europaeus TaxID=9983 RepID=UPI002B49FFEC|nr:ENTH domain-containing protein 1 [Lepus europaeus]